MVTSIRAAQLQHSLLAIERVAGAKQDRVFARIRPETLARIRGATRIEWLPVEFDLELAEAVAAELGPASDRRRARESVRLSMESPLLEPIVVGVQRIFSLEPTALIRQIPRAFQAVYRGAGWLEHQIGRGHAQVLVYSEIPKIIVDSPLYLDAIAGAFEGIYDPCEVEGQVAVEAVEPLRRRAELRFSWY